LIDKNDEDLPAARYPCRGQEEVDQRPQQELQLGGGSAIALLTAMTPPFVGVAIVIAIIVGGGGVARRGW
jgi:hypothetical protein